MTTHIPSPAGVFRLDLSCDRTGFSTPPCDVHLKLLSGPISGVWTLLALVAAGTAESVARWLAADPSMENIRAASGIAPKLIRASVKELPPAWLTVSSFAKVHHLDLCADGTASWYIEGQHNQILELVRFLAKTNSALGPTEVRWQPVQVSGTTPISRRQFEVLAAAVALGYYEIPHRIDLRTLAAHAGVSLGSVSELLRRAEKTVMAHAIDSYLMDWSAVDDPSERVTNFLHSAGEPRVGSQTTLSRREADPASRR